MNGRRGIDIAQVAHEERRAIRAKQPLPEIRDRNWFSLAVAVIGLIIAATMLIPGLAHLAEGAPDRRTVGVKAAPDHRPSIERTR